MTDTVPRYLTADALADLPGLRHGFFTRHGGTSEGIYASLNVGPGSRDRDDHVHENRRRAMAALGAPAAALTTVRQIHSATVVAAPEAWTHDRAPEADALVTDRPGVALGILTADCVPVLFADGEAGVVGAAHSGWKGAIGGVLQATIEAMEGRGARRSAIRAAVGPAIGPRSYEVGPEFPAPFLAEDPENAALFQPSQRAGHHMFDLPGYVVKTLRAAGIPVVERMARDTCAEPDDFFSYRRACQRGEPDYGRGLSVIMLGG